MIDAAENGKQVATLIELKARFDEENNIHWARDLERVGAHVVYGVAGLKTHAKVTLVVRDEPDGIRRYMHFGTGNYNDKTARIYTDLSLFTCRAELGADATAAVQRADRVSRRPTSYEQLLVAPNGLRAGFDALIDRETENARAGRPSGIMAKLNAISDAGIVRRSTVRRRPACRSNWSCAGCACCGPASRASARRSASAASSGASSSTRASLSFANGGDREVYIGSADWMGRNLDRRVETVVPVLDPALRDLICDDILSVLVADNVRSRVLQADGSYVRRTPQPGEARVDAQQTFLKRYQTL